MDMISQLLENGLGNSYDNAQCKDISDQVESDLGWFTNDDSVHVVNLSYVYITSAFCSILLFSVIMLNKEMQA